MSVYAGTDPAMHRQTCGHDGAPCPTGEHGLCPGCRDEVHVRAPIAEHEDGCPAVAHREDCPAFLTGSRADHPCTCVDRDDHRASDARITESEFRTKVPQLINGIEILQVTRFDGGSFTHHTYAVAAALTRTNGAYSTHTLIYQDDRDRFLLETGHYDFPARAAAESDAHTRIVA